MTAGGAQVAVAVLPLMVINLAVCFLPRYAGFFVYGGDMFLKQDTFNYGNHLWY